MARSFLTPINLNQNELQNVRVQNLGSAPTSPVGGQIYYDSGLLTLLQWNGTAWVALDASKNSLVLNYKLNQFAAPSANVAMGGFTLTGLAAPAAAGQAATYDWTLARPLNAFAAPTANVPMGGFTLTGLSTSPNASGQAAEYSWVIGQIQSAAAGISSKPPVAAVATTNVALSGLTAIDGYTPVAGDRILVTAQTTASANGVYAAASGAWARTTVDGAAPGEIEPGAMWLVTSGTTYAGSQWRVSTTGTITIGTTSISIVQFGASSTYSAGNGLSLAGSSFSVLPVASGGIVVSGGGVAVDTAIVARKYATTIGDGSTASFTVTHNLNTQDVHVQVRQTANPYGVVECDMSATTVNTVTIAFAAAPAASAYRVVVLG